MSRLTIDSLKAAGFGETGTGGGCTALAKEFPNATVYIADDLTVPDESTAVFQMGVQCHETGHDLRFADALFGAHAVEDGIPESDLFRCVAIACEAAANHDPEGEAAQAEGYYA